MDCDFETKHGKCVRHVKQFFRNAEGVEELKEDHVVDRKLGEGTWYPRTWVKLYPVIRDQSSQESVTSESP